MSMDAGWNQDALRAAPADAPGDSLAAADGDLLQLEALLTARVYLYTLFNKLLGGVPDGALLDALLGQETADCFEEFSAHSPQLQALSDVLAGLRGRDRAELLDAARDEYTRVFIGPGNLPASPYESPYTGEHDMGLFQENTIAVRRIYHAQGLQARREQAVPDDHVALMCAFVAELGARSAQALAAGDMPGLAAGLRGQAAFEREHLAHWLDTYAAAVRNSKAGSAAVLYPQMIEALAALVAADGAFLTESAFWVESQPVHGAQAPAPELARVRDALAALQALRPFGIQDNELVPME